MNLKLIHIIKILSKSERFVFIYIYNKVILFLDDIKFLIYLFT